MRRRLKTQAPEPPRAADSAAVRAGTCPAALRAEGVRRLERMLARRSLRLTAARRAIAEAVLERRGHFGIDELIAELRRRGVRGSRATVYRLLPLLTEAGLLQEAVFTSDERSYEVALEGGHHDHLLCLRCERVVEFHSDAFDVLERDVAARHGFRLAGHHHQLVGFCEDCQRAGGAGAADDGQPAG